jgi:hypothetical protein
VGAASLLLFNVGILVFPVLLLPLLLLLLPSDARTPLLNGVYYSVAVLQHDW